MLRVSNVRHARAVVVGSGIAGLSAALGLGRCLVLTRGSLGSGSSRLAQGGIAAALDPLDEPRAHAADTLAVGCDIADPLLAEAVAGAAAGRIEWLLSLGARFDKTASGALRLGREAGHSARRIVHADGDATGAEVMRALTQAVKARPDIELCESHGVLDLVRRDSRIVGVLAIDPSGELLLVMSAAVILATGGIGGLYARTTNPPEVLGDGLAMAARAGATLADLEFVQFHPTALDVSLDPVPLLSEALRGEGAVLINERGERFMRFVHPHGELAPRDIVARAIWEQRARGGAVYLDATRAVGADFPHRFPTIFGHATHVGIDPRFQPLPVTPAEHYHMGGVATDAEGRTTLEGLWAVGEVAATGLHGANRLASNSLLEGMVMGAAASRSVEVSKLPLAAPANLEVPASAAAASEQRAEDPIGEIRRLMWQHVGVVRDHVRLTKALLELERLQGRAISHRARNAALVGRLIAEAALKRTESRGAHWRSDYPARDAALEKRSVLTPDREPAVPLELRERRAA